MVSTLAFTVALARRLRSTSPLRCIFALGLACISASPAAAQWQSPDVPAAAAAATLPALYRAANPSGSSRPAPPAYAPAVKGASGGRVALGAAAGAAAGVLYFFGTRYPCSGDVMFCEVGALGYGAIGALAGGFLAHVTGGGGRRPGGFLPAPATPAGRRRSHPASLPDPGITGVYSGF